MYQCTRVFDADNLTGKTHSMGITTPDETTYIRAETREEKDSWYNALAEYPEMNRQEEKMRQKRAKARSYGQAIGNNKQEIQPDKPCLESTTITPIKQSESPVFKENELATQHRVSSTGGKQGMRLDSSYVQNKGGIGLRRSHSETTTNRPKRYHEIININVPSRGREEDTDSNSLNSKDPLWRRHSNPVTQKQDGSPVKVDSEKNKLSVRLHRRLDGKRPRYNTIDVLGHDGPETEHTIKENSSGEVSSELSSQVEEAPSTNSQTSALHRNNNNVNIERSISSQDTNKPVIETAPLATQEDLDVDFDGRPRTLSDLSSHSSEDLERMDIPRKSRLGLRLNKAMLDHSDSPSPSKRTIERRRHAHERRGRHTMDGSMHVMIPSSDESETSKDGASLKRSNSDPSLADSEDMMKRKQIAMTFPGFFHLKKGWLVMQGVVEQNLSKHWFVLCNNKLSYYKDTDEDPKNLDGVIDLSQCGEAKETQISRDHCFQITTADGTIILAAMTKGIRDNWVQAINKALVTVQEDNAKESTPTSEDSSPVRELGSMRKQTLPTKTSVSVSDATDSLSESSISDRTFSEKKPDVTRRGSTHRDKGRERRSKRSSRELKELNRLSDTSIDSVDIPLGGKKPNGDQVSDSIATAKEMSSTQKSGPVNASNRIIGISDVKEMSKPKVKIGEQETSNRSGMSENSTIMELLETEVESLKTQLENVQQECMRVQQENTELKALMNAVHREHKDNYQDLESEHTEYITQIEQLAEKQEELSEKNVDYEVQNERLQMELKQTKNKTDLLLQQKELLTERLTSSTTDLENKEAECKDLQDRLKSIASELMKSETNMTKAQTSLRSERERASATINELNEQVIILTEELNHLNTSHKSEMKQDGQVLQQKENDQEDNEIVETELVHMLRMQLQEAHERLQESEQDCINNEERFEKRFSRLEAKLQAEKVTLEEKLDEAEATIKSLSLQPREERMSPSRTNFDSVAPLSPLPPDASVEEIGQKLAEREQQLMELRRQLKKEVTAKSVLQEKYDDVAAKSANLPLRTNEDEQSCTVDLSVVSRLENDLASAQQEIKRLGTELEKERVSGKNIHQKLAAESMGKSELADKFKSLYKLAQKQQEELKTSRAAQTPEGAHKVISERNAIIMKLQEELRKQVTEKNNLNKSVHTLSGDLATFQAQLAGKDQDVLKLKEVLQTNICQITTLKQKLGGFESMRDELRHLQVQIEKEKGEYTVQLQNKEDQLKAITNKLGGVQTELMSLEDKLREADEASTQTENEYEKKVLKLDNEAEEMQKRIERGEKEVKRIRNELKVSQGNYDELELQFLHSQDDVKRLERLHSEQMELMGQRIQDLTNKLGASECKVRDLQYMEQKSRLATGMSQTQTAMLENNLKEVENKLGDVENTMKNQDKQSNNLQGKIVSVVQQVEAREAEPTSSSPSDRSSPLISRDSTPSLSHQESTSTSRTGPSDDTDSTSSQESTDSKTSPEHHAKFLESKLTETERKLKEVTRKLVDVTTKQLEDRKANQTRRVAESKLKEQVKDLKKQLEELNLNEEKASAIVAVSRDATAPSERDIDEGNNFVTKHSTPSEIYTNMSPFLQHELDSEKFLSKSMFLDEMQAILSLLVNMHRYIDGTKEQRKMSANVLFERNEILSSTTLFQAETSLVQFKSNHSSTLPNKLKTTCHKSSSEPIYASIVPRSTKLIRRTPSRVTLRRKPDSCPTNSNSMVVEDDDSDYSLVMPRRHSDPAQIGDMTWSHFSKNGSPLDNSRQNSRDLVELHRKWIGTVDTLKDKYQAVLECVKFEKGEIISRIGKALAKRSMQQKSESSIDKVEGRNKANKNDLGSTMEELLGGWDAELAVYAEEIAFHEAMSLAMDYVSNEIVFAEAMQGLHTRSKQLHEIIEAESESCSKVLNHFKGNASKRYECLEKSLEDVVITIGEEVRQSYYNALAGIQAGYCDDELSNRSDVNESLVSLIGSLADMMLTLAVADGVVNYLCLEGCEVGLEKHSNVGLVTDLDIMDGIPSPRTSSPCELTEVFDLIDLNTEAQPPDIWGDLKNRSKVTSDESVGLEGLLGDSYDIKQSLLNLEAQEFAILLADKAIAHAEAVYMADCVLEEWERTVETAHASVMETIAAEHAHDIATIRQTYETLVAEEHRSHTAELAHLQGRCADALQKISNLQDDLKKVVALHANKPDITVTMTQDTNELVEEMVANKMQRIEADMEATRIRLKEAQLKLEIQSEEHVQEVDAITGIMETMELKYKQELKALRAQYIGRVEELEAGMHTRLERHREVHKQELVVVVRRHRSDIARMTQEHNAALAVQMRNNSELMAQEKSHREQLSELRESCQQQLKGLQDEKDKQLHEEAQATAKVIASLQEKHEQEIEDERVNLQGNISSDVEAVMKRHREIVSQMNKEWQILSQKFSQVCQENTQLSKHVETLARSLADSQQQAENLLSQNRELGNRLTQEVLALSKPGEVKGEGISKEEVLQVDRNDNEQVTPMKVALHIREVELQCANEELKTMRVKLEGALQREKDSVKLTFDLEAKCKSHQDYIEALKGEVDDLQQQVQRVRTSGEGAAAQDEPTPEVV